MNNGSRFIIVLILVSLSLSTVLAQTYVIKGRVMDSQTGDPVPFANIFIKSTTKGATTDFQGYYSFTSDILTDSLIASYIGYKRAALPLQNTTDQIMNFQLFEDVVSLNEVVFYAGENPAFEIMRRVIANKKNNDKRELEAYEYESYVKTEIDIDNLSEKFKEENDIMRQVAQVLDSIEVIVGENGKPLLPIFISEAISKFYYRKNPRLTHENIIKTKITGIGITDGTLTSQVIGSTFQEYNFYQNWMTIVNKNFISPIADGWKGTYDYYLIDSLYLGSYFCYRLDMFPKREQDLAFRGTIWIDKETYALKQIDATVDRSANINWIEKIRIQQELEPSEAGPWLPSKTRVLLDAGELSNDVAGVLAKFYTSNKDVVVNQPYEDSFYRIPVVMDENVRVYQSDYWVLHRHDSLSSTEIHVYEMIDTLKTIPSVRRLTDLGKFAATGYHKVGKIDLGPYPVTMAYNDVEGLRLGFGLRTNIDFSDKWILKGAAGYGFRDEEWKYRVGVEYIISRKPWTKIGIESRKEIDRMFLLTNDLDYGSLFYSYSRFGSLRDPFRSYTNRIYFKTQLSTGLNQEVFFKTGYYEPLFPFAYYENPQSSDPTLKSTMNTTEIGIETRFAKDELFIINDNNRISMGTYRWPVITFRYSLGLKDVLDGDFNYHKFELSIRRTQKMGKIGYGRIRLTGGYIIGQLPYPLLKNHIGNESPFFIGFAYNLMDFSEFTSDQYVTIKYKHSFDGMILNRVPLVKKLKWRLLATANVLWGDVRQENFDIIPEDFGGVDGYPFKKLGSTPYVELGYGIENILRVVRIDFVHRLTYLEDPGTRHFGIKFSFEISF